MTEVWRHLPGMEHLQVSDWGRIKGSRGGILKVQEEKTGD